MLIKGKPAREVKEITRIWGPRRSHSYKNLDDDIALSETTVDLNPEASTYKVITRLTGHGHHSNTGSYPHCCEWKDNTHYLYIDGDEIANWNIFQYNECALNPVYPQGGTWPGAREGWCPGDVVKDNEFEITEYVNGQQVNIDYDITPVPANNQGMGSGNYIVAMQLIQYGDPNYTLDAEVYDILSPNDWEYYSRFNPICREPRIMIRNSGAQDLTSLTITYSVDGGDTKTYQWSGNLKFNEKAEVSLPLSDYTFWLNAEEPYRFRVALSAPNGGQDERTENDVMTSSFDIPAIYPTGSRLRLSTNNKAFENTLTIKDMDGNVVFSRSNMTNATTYNDTLNLPDGCYTLELLDTGNDGLSYWANTSQGNGSLRILRPTSQFPLEFFEPEFGRSIHHTFFLGDISDIPELDDAIAFDVFPNPAHDQFRVEVFGMEGAADLYLFNALGQVIESRKVQSVNGGVIETFDASALRAGLYFVQLRQGAAQRTVKVVML